MKKKTEPTVAGATSTPSPTPKDQLIAMVKFKARHISNLYMHDQSEETLADVLSQLIQFERYLSGSELKSKSIGEQ